MFTVDELAALAEVVERHGGRVIADEVHAPLVYPGHHHVPYASVSDVTAAHTVTVTSASKGWNIPGLRCAQVIATNRSDAARWRTLPTFAVPGPTPLGVAASVAAYRDGGPWLAELLPYLEANRRVVGAVLAAELPAARGGGSPRAPTWPGSTAPRSGWTTRPRSSSTMPASR